MSERDDKLVRAAWAEIAAWHEREAAKIQDLPRTDDPVADLKGLYPHGMKTAFRMGAAYCGAMAKGAVAPLTGRDILVRALFLVFGVAFMSGWPLPDRALSPLFLIGALCISVSVFLEARR